MDNKEFNALVRKNIKKIKKMRLESHKAYAMAFILFEGRNNKQRITDKDIRDANNTYEYYMENDEVQLLENELYNDLNDIDESDYL